MNRLNSASFARSTARPEICLQQALLLAACGNLDFFLLAMHYLMWPGNSLTAQMQHSETDIPLIYIVDDDATMRLLMIDAIESDGYRIKEFANGMDALAAYSKSRPDMIMLDVRMPVLNGFDICEEIRSKHGDTDTSIVMVTGLDDPASIEQSFKVGATAFISKPINWITLPHEIRYLLKARNAFVSLKQSETQLEHMDSISRIITQHKDKDIVLQESVNALLDIFNAERAFIIHSTDSSKRDIDIEYEAARNDTGSTRQNEQPSIIGLDENILYRAANSEYPLVSASAEHNNGEPDSGIHAKTQMIRSLRADEEDSWYLAIQKKRGPGNWSQLALETFYRISIRLGSVLSQHLLLERLHNSEHLLRQAQHIGHIGNWCWNQKTGKVSWSDETYRIYGHEPGSFTPSYGDFSKFVYKDDYDLHREFEQASFDSGETHSIEYRIILPTGDIRWVHEQAIGLIDDHGQLIEVNGIVQDITERLKKQEQQMHDHKMEAIGQLTSGIAHDFGNLMTIAHGNLGMLYELLTEKRVVNDEFMELLDDANSAINDGVELTRQLLSFSRKQSMAPQYLDVGDTIRKYRKLIDKTLSEKIRLSTNLQDNLPEILVDPVMFVSSLINIIINARDAMPDGGQLSITTELINAHADSRFHNPDEQKTSTYLRITVEDTGTGMSDSVMQHAVEPFFTTKEEGTGLGLSLAYSFMRQSNGELKIETIASKGSRVLMHFPVHAIEQTIPAAQTGAHAKPSQRFTVLVVEDNAAVRQLVVRCLHGQGLNTLEAEDSASAQTILERDIGIDMLFSDILMPGDMNGRDLANWAHRKYPELSILLTTAAQKEAMQLMQASGCPYHVLLKPFSNQDLVNKVLNILMSATPGDLALTGSRHSP